MDSNANGAIVAILALGGMLYGALFDLIVGLDCALREFWGRSRLIGSFLRGIRPCKLSLQFVAISTRLRFAVTVSASGAMSVCFAREKAPNDTPVGCVLCWGILSRLRLSTRRNGL